MAASQDDLERLIGMEVSEGQVARIKALDPMALQVVVAGFNAGTGMGIAAARPLW